MARPIILVTGATGGVGSVLVPRLVDRGWHVLAASRAGRSPEGTEVTPIPLDLDQPESVAAAVDMVRDISGGRLQALVNNAGISLGGPADLLDATGWHRQFYVNMIGPALLTSHLMPDLRTARGRVVNVSGAIAGAPLPYHAGLGASKAAMSAWSATLRMECLRTGVRVTTIEPGGVDTDFFAEDRDGPHAAGEAATAAAAVRRSSTLPPTAVAAAITDALKRRKPPGRVRVGSQARFAIPALGMVPTGTRDHLVRRSLGLR